MICIAGNPVLSAPNGKGVEEAFKELDFMVCSDYIWQKQADLRTSFSQQRPD